MASGQIQDLGEIAHVFRPESCAWRAPRPQACLDFSNISAAKAKLPQFSLWNYQCPIFGEQRHNFYSCHLGGQLSDGEEVECVNRAQGLGVVVDLRRGYNALDAAAVSARYGKKFWARKRRVHGNDQIETR